MSSCFQIQWPFLYLYHPSWSTILSDLPYLCILLFSLLFQWLHLLCWLSAWVLNVGMPQTTAPALCLILFIPSSRSPIKNSVYISNIKFCLHKIPPERGAFEIRGFPFFFFPFTFKIRRLDPEDRWNGNVANVSPSWQYLQKKKIGKNSKACMSNVLAR